MTFYPKWIWISKSVQYKQAEKLKSREMKEGWMKNEWRMMKDKGWMMKDDDF